LIAEERESDPLAFEVRDLRGQLKVMAHELDRLAQLVENRNAAKAG
jgi:hypothetical protein